MKKKGFTLIELIVVIAIIAVIAACLLPVFIKTPKSTGIVITIALILGVLFGASYIAVTMELEREKAVIVFIIAILISGGIGFGGYKLLDSNMEDGEVKSVSWLCEIVIDDNDGNEVKRYSESGNDKSPKWPDYNVPKNCKVGKRILTLDACILTEDGIKIFQMGEGDWNSIEVGDHIEFEYQKYKNYITKVYGK